MAFFKTYTLPECRSYFFLTHMVHYIVRGELFEIQIKYRDWSDLISLEDLFTTSQSRFYRA